MFTNPFPLEVGFVCLSVEKDWLKARHFAIFTMPAYWSDISLNGNIDRLNLRKKQFLLGRYGAYLLQSSLNLHAGACKIIDKYPNGSPKWPASRLGSISHSHDCVVVAMVAQCDSIALALDVQKIVKLRYDIGSRITRNIAACQFRDADILEILPYVGFDIEIWQLRSLIILSVKECFYKSLNLLKDLSVNLQAINTSFCFGSASSGLSGENSWFGCFSTSISGKSEFMADVTRYVYVRIKNGYILSWIYDKR